MMNNYNSLSPGRDTRLKRTWQKKLALLVFFVLFSVLGTNAQVTTNSGSGLNPTYPDLASAVTALNTATITSPVVITLGGAETAPVGGYVITATGTSTNTITFTGGSNTVTASAAQVVGGKVDAIFKVVGGDYITIQNFTMRENAANTVTAVATNTMTEFGVALFLASATDGAQNNTIQNNDIALGSTYQNTFGIFSTSSFSSTNGVLAATATSGTNSNNKVYGNTISSVAYGVGFICEPVTATITESGNDIGGTAAGTGNIITYGVNTAADAAWTRFSAAIAGIYYRNGAGFNARFNALTSNAMTLAVNGINISSGTAPVGVAYTATISNNTINIASIGTGAILGINFGHGNSTATFACNSNTVNISQSVAVATSAQIWGILAGYAYISNTVNNNNVTITQSSTGTGANSGQLVGLACHATTTVAGSTQVSNNNVITFKQNAPTSTGTYTGLIAYMMTANGSGVGTGTINNNQLLNTGSTLRTTAGVYGFYHDNTYATSVTFDGNTVTLDRTGAGAINVFYCTSTGLSVAENYTNNNISIAGSMATGVITVFNELGGLGATGTTKTITGNTININTPTLTSTPVLMSLQSSFGSVSNNSFTVATAGSITGSTISSTAPGAWTFNNNTYSLTSTGTSPTITGILLANGSGHVVSNNTFNTINASAAAASAPSITAISITSTATAAANNVFGNKILSIVTGTGTGSATITGINISGAGVTNVYKNKISGVGTNTTGTSSVVRGVLVAGGVTNNIYNNTIGNLTNAASNIDAIRGISLTSATANSSLNVYNNAIFLNATGGTNFGVSGIYHTANATATTAALDLRNNIVINTSTPGTTGVVTALRRSAVATLGNFAATSDRNMFYAGPTAANRTIMYDGTNAYQTMATYIGAVGPTREANSFTDATFTYPTAGSFFTSVTGSSADFLKPVTGIATIAESGGSTVSISSPDFNGVVRPASPGTGWDLGAFEFDGVTPAPSVVLTSVTPPVSPTLCTKAGRTVVVDVTAGSGTISSVTLNYSHNGVAQTPVVMTNTSGNSWSGTMSPPTAGNATVNWSVTATNSVPLNTTYTGTSYSDEPLTGVTATATASLPTICAGSSSTLSVGLNKTGGNATLGAGALTSSGSGGSGGTNYSNPFYHYYGGLKEEYIIRASELTASGLAAGNITSVSFDVTTAGITYNGFSMNMANTAATVATTTFTSAGLTNVFGGNLAVTATGLKTITFTTPFPWDGTSNVVVQLCWSNANTGGAAAEVKFDNTSFVSNTYNRVDSSSAASVCGATTTGLAGSTTSTRPKMIFAGNVPPTATAYSWSDGSTVVGTTNNLLVTPTTNTTYTATVTSSGCTVASSTVTVTVIPQPTAPTATNSAQCGTQMPTASVADANGFTTPTFKWYADNVTTTALQTSTSTTYTTAISTTTTFYVSVVNPSTSCESVRTPVTVTVSVPDAISATPSAATVCVGTSFTLTAANTAGSPVNTYSYSWSSTAGSGASSPVAGSPATITASAPGTYVYTVIGTDGGCVTTATTSVTVIALPTITASAASPTICGGTSTALTALTSTVGGGTATIGTATTRVLHDAEITMFNNRRATYHIQLLYKASELTAAGLFAGNITALSFNIDDIGSAATNTNFTVKMGTTALAAFTDFVATTGYTTVFPSATYTHAVGNNVITFSTPFNWNGTSNVVVDVTMSGIDSLYNGTNDYTATTGNTVAYAYDGTATASLSTSRFNVKISGQVATTGAGTLTYTWNPGNFTGNVYTVSPTTTTAYTVTAQDPATTCSTSQVVTVTVNPQPTAPTGTDSSQCGAGVPTASVMDTNGFTTPTFKWYGAPSGGTALQSSTSNTYTTSIAATTIFYVSVVNPTTLCESNRTPVTVTFAPADSVTITPSTTSPCVNSAFTLGASSVNAGYVYTWTASPALGSGITSTMTGPSISVTPTEGGTYVYTVSGTDGNCTANQTVSITVISPIVVATATPATLCAGSSSQLTALTGTISSGNVTIGAGANTINGATTSLGSPYNNWYGGMKQQIIYTKAELQAAGITAGNFSALAWELTALGTSLTMNDFTINMGHTTQSAGTTTLITSGLTQVYSNAAQGVSVGVNTYTFSTPFNWNGTDNIVISVCFSNNNAGSTTSQPTIKVDDAGFVSTSYIYADSTTVGALFTATSNTSPGVGTTSQTNTTTNRPKIVFNAVNSVLSPGSLVYTWDNGAGSGSSVSVTPSTTTTYTVSAFDSSTGCTATKSVIVTVNPVPTAPIASNSTQCGAGVPTASVSNPNAFATPTFKWYADNVTTTALQSSTSTTYTTSIAATTTFYVSVTNPATGCESTRTPVTVTYTAPAAIVPSPGATATGCVNQPLAVSVTSANGSYVYTWTASPIAGSGIPTSTTGSTPSITPTATGVYVYTIAANDGTCSISSTITVTVNESPSAITINQTGSVCAGEVITLTATGGTVASSATLGTNNAPTKINTNGVPYRTGTTVGNEEKVQYLILASELSAAGIQAGNISSLAFTVTSGGGGTMSNLTFKMANVSDAVLTSTFVSPAFTSVLTLPTYSPVVGVNSHTFSAPFTWNGTSNVLVQICGQLTTGGAGCEMATFTTPATTTVAVDAATGCSTTTGTTFANARPVITFGYTPNVGIVWTPSTELYTDLAATTSYSGGQTNVVYAKITAGRTYTATATYGSCSTDKVVTLAAPSALPVFTVASASICKGVTTAPLSAVSGESNTYTWANQTGPNSGLNTYTGPNVTANPAATTTYVVTATSNLTGCSSTQLVTVTVVDPGSINAGLSTTVRTVSPGVATTFFVSTTGTGLSYQWQVSIDNGATWNDVADDGNYDNVTTNTLAVHDIDLSFDGYKYRALVSAASPCTALTPVIATLNVASTGFVDQPVDATVCNTGTASYFVTTSGDAPFFVQWQMSTDNGATFFDINEDSGDPVNAGLTFTGVNDLGTLTLNVSGITTAQNGYQFQAQLNFGLNSVPALLTVNTPVSINTQPLVTQTVCVGTNASFSVAVDPLSTTPTYQWEVSTTADNGATYSAYAVISGAISATLNLTAVPASANLNKYRVVITGGMNCPVVTSDPGVLQITNPIITTQPANAIAVVPSSASMSVATSAPSPTYQWQYSATAGGTYANVPGASQPGVTYTGATSATLGFVTTSSTAVSTGYYKVIVTSEGCSVTSNAAQLDVKTYCLPTYSNGPVSAGVPADMIANVQLGTLNNPTTDSPSPFYIFYDPAIYTSVAIPDITQLTTASVSVTFGDDTSNNCAVWIDFNQNGVFEASEGVVSTSSSAGVSTSGGTTIISIPVPLTALTGHTRMRVRGGEDVTLTTAQACGASSDADGEAEDYIVNVVAAPVCTGTPDAGTADATVKDICMSGSSVLSVSGYTTGVTGITFQWYNSAGIINTATNTSYTTPTLTSSETYYVRVTCTATGLFADSAPVTVTVNNPSVVSTTPGTRCGVGTVALSAVGSAGTNLSWYSAATGGTALFTGTNFTTPSISANTTYYVDASAGGSTGSVGNVGPATTNNGTSVGSHGIMITTTQPNVKINSVDIPFTGTGTITIALKDTANTTVIASAVSGTVTGNGLDTVTVPIDLNIATAGNYILVVNAVSGSVGALGYKAGTYPYTALSGAISVTSGYWYASDPSTMYLFNLNVSIGCTSARTPVVATVTAPPTLTLSGSGTAICVGATTGLVNVSSTVANFDTYTWSPNTNVSGSAATGYTFNPSVTTTYTLTAANAAGCVNTVTYIVTVNPLPVASAITPASATICQGVVQMLTTGSGGGTATFGAGTTAPSTTSFPNPLSAYYGGSKHQILFTAAELTAQGLQPGSTINALTFYLNNFAANACTNFTIRMGATTNTSLSGFVSGTATVYGPLTFTPSATGLKSFTLTTPYVWDGVSGLVVETVHNAGNGGNGSGTRTRTTTTTNNSVYYGSTDNVAGGIAGYDALTAYGTSGTSTARPNMTFTFVNTAPTWAPTTGLYTNAAGTTAYTGAAAATVYAKPPTGTTTYVATFTSAAGCTSTNSTTITVNPTPTATAPSAQSYCAGATTSAIALVGTPSGVVFDINGGAGVGLSNQTGVTSIPSFTAVAGSATITVTPRANGCTGTPVTYTILVSPATVAGSISGGGTTVCAGSNSGLMTLSGQVGAVVRWESSVSPFSVWTPIAATAGATTYTSGALSQTTKFRAVVQSGVCTDIATADVTTTVNSVTLGSVTSAPVCLNTDAIVTLNGLVPNSAFTMNYTKSGVPQTPISFTAVQNATGSVTFNVPVTGAGQNVVITSIVRTDVTPTCPLTPSSGNSVTFVLSSNCSTVQPSQCSVTLPTIDAYVYANLVASATAYRWRVTTMTGPTAGQVQPATTVLRNLRLTSLGTYAFATQYKIEVAAMVGSVWAPYGTPCTVSTPATTTSLTNCGVALTNMNDVIYANNVPFAAGYKFRITDPGTPTNTTVLFRPTREFRMNLITDFLVKYNRLYNVEVSVKNTDGTYLPYGPICNVNTPVFPTTSLQDSQCDDYIVPTMTTVIYANSYPGAIKYVFQLKHGTDPAVEITKNLRSFTLSEFTGLIPGQIYDVKVRLIFDLNDPIGPYGKTCSVLIPGSARQEDAHVTKAIFTAVAYPNPFAENFNIDVTTSTEDKVTVRVYDMTGRLLEEHVDQVSQMETLKVGDRYPSGVYNVIVTQGDNAKTLRVIKR